MDLAGVLSFDFVALAGMWLGAALYQLVVTGPAMAAAGDAGMGFAQALARRRGTGMLFAALAVLTVLAGLGMYLLGRVYLSAATAQGWFLTSAVVTAIIALARGATANRLGEGRFLSAWLAVKGSPTSAQLGQIAALAKKAARANLITAAFVGWTLLCGLVGQALT